MSTHKTLRLLMPQWQGGGNNPAYSLGAYLLEWLAPKSNSPTIEIPIKPYDASQIKKENGIVEQSTLLKQLEYTTQIIQDHHPDNIVIFGGDCLVEQAPISYLNQRYDGNLGVLWLDAHPDVTTPKEFQHEHAMVLGNLLGEGDPAFAAKVPIKLNPKIIMLGGLQPTLAHETETIQKLAIQHASPEALAKNSDPVLQWVKEEKIKKLFVHLDLDVLDPKDFNSQLFTKIQQHPESFVDGLPQQGAMTIQQITQLIKEVALKTEIVGLGITEHMPWDAIHLKNMLEQFSIMKD